MTKENKKVLKEDDGSLPNRPIFEPTGRGKRGKARKGDLDRHVRQQREDVRKAEEIIRGLTEDDF